MTPDPGDSIDRSGQISLVFTTVPNAEVGEALVRTLVEERLIACGNLVPGVVSIYNWEGKVEREQEMLVVMKVAASSVGAVFARISQVHPYQVPELVEVSVEGVSRAYGGWVKENSKVPA